MSVVKLTGQQLLALQVLAAEHPKAVDTWKRGSVQRERTHVPRLNFAADSLRRLGLARMYWEGRYQVEITDAGRAYLEAP